MLSITVPIGEEQWDEENEEFVYPERKTIQLEHSLISLSKWESKWKKAFLSKKERTPEETIDYIKCMTVTQNVDPRVYEYLTNENIEQINQYICDPMTATYFREEKNAKTSREVVTSELIYYWMIAFNIPQEYQKWHLNRLLTLIRVCELKSSPPKKKSMKEIWEERTALNAERKKKLNTKG